MACFAVLAMTFFLLPSPVSAGELANQFTISLWVNPTTSIASKALVVKDSEIRLVTDASGNPLCQIYASGTWQTAVTSSTALTLNSWANVSCTYNKANIYVYVNGTQTGSGAQTNAVNDAATNLLTGQDDSGTYANFIGTTDHLQVYNYARNQKQVIEDMGGGHPAVTAGPSGPSTSSGRPAGPVGYWKFDEGQGTTANNSGSGGSALNGTLTGMATAPSTTTSGWTQAGKFNRALNFDGGDDYVSLPTTAQLNGLSAASIEAWVYPTSGFTSDYRSIYYISTAGATNNFVLQTITGTGAVRFFINPTSCDTTETLSPNRWTHVAGVYDGSNMMVYIGGILKKTCAKSGTISDSGVAKNIGRYEGNAYYWLGQLDEVKIYPYALTADEVKLDYNKGSSLVLGALSDNSSTSFTSSSSVQGADHEYCIPGDSTSCASPVGRWDFDEGAGTSVKDVSGNGYNGTITGATYKLGKIGKALNFNDSSDVVDTISSIPGIQTISFWVNPSTTTQNLIDLQTTPGTINVSVSGGALSATGFTLPTYYVNGVATATPTLTANAWSHVEITTGTAVTGSAVRFGRISTTSLTGRLDNIRFFNYARSGAQVAWDYNRGAPVGHWKFDECQGDTAHDSSGNSNHGTINLGTTGTQTTAIGMGTCTVSASTPWYNGRTGKFNYSLNFDGTDDYVTITSFSALPTSSSSRTVSAWAKYTGTLPSSSDHFVIAYGGSTASTLFSLFAQGSTNRWAFGGYADDMTASTLDQNWHHLVATYDGTTVRMYVDGILQNSSNKNLNTTSANIIVGNINISGFALNRPFPGQIDDVRVYNYALTATQVKLLSNQGAAVRYGPFLGVP